MAVVPIKVPKVSESISEGILSQAGSRPTARPSRPDEPLYELETDKASQVFIAPNARNGLKIGVKPKGKPSRSNPSSARSTPTASPRTPVAKLGRTSSQGPFNCPHTVAVSQRSLRKLRRLKTRHRRFAQWRGRGDALAPSVRRIVAETQHVDPSAGIRRDRTGRTD